MSYDNRRLMRLNEEGVTVLVFDDLDVKKDINWVLNQIVEYLQKVAR